MTVGFDTFFPKKSSTRFVVRNISGRRGRWYKKRVRIFNQPILDEDTFDLLAIPAVSEADIRHALLKGELRIKLETRELEVVYSNIDLLQFDKDGPDNQFDFLQSVGITDGLEVTGTADLVPFYQDVSVTGTQNGSNVVFIVPDKFLYTTENKITVYLNGVRQQVAENFLIAESGGPGTGYDTIIFIEAPRSKDVIRVDYFKAT